jgi:hypothetical protein
VNELGYQEWMTQYTIIKESELLLVATTHEKIITQTSLLTTHHPTLPTYSKNIAQLAFFMQFVILNFKKCLRKPWKLYIYGVDQNSYKIQAFQS